MNRADYNYYPIKSYYKRKEPIDIALFPISKELEEKLDHTKVVEFSRFDSIHDPVLIELLFFSGFAVKNSKFVMETQFADATYYLSQESMDVNEKVKSTFNMHYDLEKIIPMCEDQRDIPIPPGFSGSLVWNSNFLKCQNLGIEWNPSFASVTGILKRWVEKENLLLSTKVEYFNFGGLINTKLSDE